MNLHPDPEVNLVLHDVHAWGAALCLTLHRIRMPGLSRRADTAISRRRSVILCAALGRLIPPDSVWLVTHAVIRRGYTGSPIATLIALDIPTEGEPVRLYLDFEGTHTEAELLALWQSSVPGAVVTPATTAEDWRVDAEYHNETRRLAAELETVLDQIPLPSQS